MLTPLLIALLLAALPARAQEALFLVRHAEKVDNSKDAALSAAGAARTEKLATMLRDAGIQAIFTTEFQRTRATAQPLAAALKLKPVVHAADDTAGLVALLRKERGRALAVGHGDTLPEIAAAYGVKLSVGDGEFDGLYVIVPATKTLIHLHQ
jgi:phosphohistidine phosphatase SixA